MNNIALDHMKDLSIDEIVDLYRLGYRLEENTKILENKILGDPIVDPFVNFGKVTVSTGYTSTDTVIVLSSGNGAILPDPSASGAFNLVWWNSTDYSDPTDDPNKEIVRITGRIGDILTVVRSQEGSVASTKNSLGKTYRMINALTAKTIGNLQSYTDTSVENHRLTGIHAIGQPPQIHAGEAHKGNIVSTSSNYNVTTSDDTILCNASSVTISIYLPSSSARVGKIYNIKKTDSSSNNIIIVPAGTDAIEGSATKTISSQWGYYTLQSDGISNWIILSSTYGLISLSPLGESVISYNSPPYAGLKDTINSSESSVVANLPPQAGLADSLNNSESVTVTN